jgi:hypothetical protein
VRGDNEELGVRNEDEYEYDIIKSKGGLNMKNFRIIFAVFFLFGLCVNIVAQHRGGELEIVNSDGLIIGQFTDAHALVIGEGEYTNGWRRLPGVKDDVSAVKKLFEEQGFIVETLENVNSLNLRNGIINFLDKYGYNADTRIIVYFAGHGATLEPDGQKRGYIVPVDAPPLGNNRNFLQTAIPLTQFEASAKQYTSCHISFMFDSCFAGSIFRSRGSPPPAINRLISLPVRQFITSGDAGEEVDDESKFRRELEHALRYGAADANKDGYVSGTELGEYLYNQVSNYTNGKQNPQIGKLKDTIFDKGDFIFVTDILLSKNNNNQGQWQEKERQHQEDPPKKGTKEFFVGKWVSTVEYNNSYDTYQIDLSATNGHCTIKISNDTAEQETSGRWSYNGTTFKLEEAVFRNPTIAYQKNIRWVSLITFAEDNNSFNILGRVATNGPQIRFTFYRE